MTPLQKEARQIKIHNIGIGQKSNLKIVAFAPKIAQTLMQKNKRAVQFQSNILF